MVIGEDTVVPGGVRKEIVSDPEVLKKEEKRLPDQNPPLHEPGTASTPVHSDHDEKREARILAIGDGYDHDWEVPDDGDPVIEAPIEPEPEIDQVDVSKEKGAEAPGKPSNRPVMDPEGEMGINPEPDRSPGAPPTEPIPANDPHKQ